MAYLLGALVGGFLVATLLGLLFGLAFKLKEPSDRALRAAGLGWIACSIIASIGMADVGSFRFDVAIYYFPGAILAFFYLRWHYRKMWCDDENQLDGQFE